ncbi:MAG: beta-ketoacyl-ACP synthase 3 [Propionibacteriaceae bacterium]|jgi:3-oxoacyl-[acyl-carrier-protein] synthase-3|nr:beta-ketoacyl-ACP synthase 3 [Propionibacteriaceae bacterium]
MSNITAPTFGGQARLLSVAGYRGSQVVTNAEMCQWLDSSDEWIKQRTGITERRWAKPDETVLQMAINASENAIRRAGLTASDIDAVVVSTVSHHQPSPALAPTLAAALGTDGVPAFDISAACAGFCYLVEVARSLIASGAARHVLIAASERLSDLIDRSDRSTAFLFGDGAGAAVVGVSDTPGIGTCVWGTDGTRDAVVGIEAWPNAVAAGHAYPQIFMDGPQVFRWAATEVAAQALAAVEAAGITPADLDVFIGHQANSRIIDAMLRRLNLPEHVTVSRDIRIQGNTSAASIPIAMAELLESGAASPGQLALIVGFGAGLTYAAQVVTLP